MKNYSFEFDEYGIKLFEAIKKYDHLESIDYSTIQKAFDLAKRCHEGQNRKSGDPYYSHPVAVAGIVAEYDCSTDMICAALLHDTVEDTTSTINTISFVINKQVGLIVDSITNLNIKDCIKLSDISNTHKIHQSKKTVLLKLCDRLHNTCTMQHMKPQKVEKKIKENIITFIPVAKAYGFIDIKNKLEIESEKLIKTLNLFNDN